MNAPLPASSLTAPAPWRPARRAARMNPSVLREILKLAERPGMISLSGGLPAADAFPVEAIRAATDRVLAGQSREALQYAASEGYGPLREWIAAKLAAKGMAVAPSQVLVTTGSQQGLDLIGKVLLDAGSPVAVECPTYLGALQAFAPFEPEVVELAGDADGPLPDALRAAAGARCLYAIPSFQNPSGRCIGAPRRVALAAAAAAAGVPIVEDDPYGELWYDTAPPAALASHWPEGTIHLGSFSKVLAPGLRVGYLVAPPAIFPKLLQAKQAADLHTPGFNQRIVHETVKDGLLDTHLPALRRRYRAQRDAMQAALERHLPAGCRWQAPSGGMFFWVELPEGVDAARLLKATLARGVAFVPGAAFHAAVPRPNTLRLSFVTVAPEQIERGVGLIAEALREATSGVLRGVVA